MYVGGVSVGCGKVRRGEHRKKSKPENRQQATSDNVCYVYLDVRVFQRFLFYLTRDAFGTRIPTVHTEPALELSTR